MKELEFKFLLGKSEFTNAQEIIEKIYPNATKKEIFQINYYYYNDSELCERDTTIRIRQKGNSLRLQMKTHLKSDKEYSCCKEEETEIDKVYGSIVIGEKTYLLQGSLNTRRISYEVQDDIKVEFDTNTYLGVEDYEIEIEFAEEKHQDVLKVIDLLNLQTHTRGKGKAKRFFNLKRSIDKNYYSVT